MRMAVKLCSIEYSFFTCRRPMSQVSNLHRTSELRLRVFAGPNGSGKSTIVNAVRGSEVNGYPIDLGVFINADEITDLLKKNRFDFSQYKGIKPSLEDLIYFAEHSGLLGKNFPSNNFRRSFALTDNRIELHSELQAEQLGQQNPRKLIYSALSSE